MYLALEGIIQLAIPGQLGEEWVVESLQKAFPNNTSIVRTNSNHTGDVIFRVENTDKMIMFEVKDVKKNSIAGLSQGKDMFTIYKNRTIESFPHFLLK